MFWALASSALVIYLYCKLKAEGARAPGEPAGTVETELAVLEARIASLEDRISRSGAREKTP